MIVIPAIDIINGQCVRLTQGDYAQKTTYSTDPVSVALDFKKGGATMIHIIDLDGAKAGEPANSDCIVEMAKKLKMPIEVGGGIRTYENAEWYLTRGISRVIIGTKALTDKKLLLKLLEDFGAERIVVSLDIRDGKLSTQGWLENTEISLSDFINEIKVVGVTRVIVTDVTRDGTLTEPNFALIEEVQKSGLKVVAAGGVSSADSLKKLAAMKVDGAIIGKALYEKKLSLAEAMTFSSYNNTLSKRIIPCLDVANGRVVKGVHFENLRDSGDPVELAKMYYEQGADELVFLDIKASQENRSTMLDVVRRVSENIFLPFTVGGGIKTTDDIRALLAAGADKVCLNTAAVKNPKLIQEASQTFGAQCVMVAIDIKKTDGEYRVYINGGKDVTDLDLLEWAKNVENLGAGEILLTSMDRDGTKEGFDLEILNTVSSSVSIPVIASGGAGKAEDFRAAFCEGKADAVLAASIFHYKETTIGEIKKYLSSCPACSSC